MATSALAYIVDTLVSILDDETTFDVVRVRVPSKTVPDGKTIVYPYVAGIEYPEVTENGKRDLWGIARCEIMCDGKVKNDAGRTGLGTIEAGLIARKVMQRINDVDTEAIARNDDTVFYTRIIGIYCDGHVGHFDINDGTIQMGLSVIVHIHQTRK